LKVLKDSKKKKKMNSKVMGAQALCKSTDGSQASLKPAFSKKMPVLPEIRSPNAPVLRMICHPYYPIGRGFQPF
jgi:hypothetical protein